MKVFRGILGHLIGFGPTRIIITTVPLSILLALDGHILGARALDIKMKVGVAGLCQAHIGVGVAR
ncbi:hypothetical protein HW44_06800 [Nitrosococcus oceani]|nr:hypothetical protein HW44_06800 [Nitrosococcus oceani]